MPRWRCGGRSWRGLNGLWKLASTAMIQRSGSSGGLRQLNGYRNQLQSIRQRRQRPQLFRRSRWQAKKLQVGRDLLEQHVRAHLKAATTRLGGFEEGGHLGGHHDFSDEGAGRHARHVHGHGVALVHAQGRGVDHHVATGGVV